ncbi:unnamed protein product [Jaminaea pallidilutea]
MVAHQLQKTTPQHKARKAPNMASTLQDDGRGLRQRTSAKSSSSATAKELTPNAANVAPRGPPPPFTVYMKLAVFSMGMFVLPLATYFGLVNRLGSAWAGGAAAVAANVVLVGYIIAAFLEDGEMGNVNKDKGGAKAATQDRQEKDKSK